MLAAVRSVSNLKARESAFCVVDGRWLSSVVLVDGAAFVLVDGAPTPVDDVFRWSAAPRPDRRRDVVHALSYPHLPPLALYFGLVCTACASCANALHISCSPTSPTNGMEVRRLPTSRMDVVPAFFPRKSRSMSRTYALRLHGR